MENKETTRVDILAWSERAHTAIAAINQRLKLESSDRRAWGGDPQFACSAMTDDLDALIQSYAEMGLSSSRTPLADYLESKLG